MTSKSGTNPTAKLTIVGLGASAGGLDALATFFRHLPVDTGMAFVLVSHLDPTHASILSEILQRTTTMPVVEVTDRMTVAANRVHVIPSNRDMTLRQGALHLSLPEQPHGQRLPIDTFFLSLALECGASAIGIVLSGTGSDGTLGLRAITGAGGIGLVQDPASAQYDGMPTSAINAGAATHVVTPELMPDALQAHIRYPNIASEPPPAPATISGMNQILLLLRTGTGHDFSGYKKSTIGRRIERRQTLHGIEDITHYARYLKEHPAEIQALFKELLINVTSFFRDPEAFVTLKKEVLPQILDGKPPDYVVRLWVTGCATGEEAYSIAIILREVMEESGRQLKTQFYATDLDDDAIAIARAGFYPLTIAQDVSPERLGHFFVKEDNGYRVKKEVREMVVFATQNVIKDPPFTKMDLVSCRNLMIYLETEVQNRLIPAFHYALKPGGILFLSPSESIGGHTELFFPLNRKWKFYRTSPSIASARAMLASGLSWTTGTANKPPVDVMSKTKETNIAELTRRALVQSFAPVAVMTDHKGDILYVHGDTSLYLRPPPGQATLNAVEMAHEGLQLELRSALNQAVTQATPTLEREVSFMVGQEVRRVSLGVRPLPTAEPGLGLILISFQEMPAIVASDKPVRRRRAGGSVDRTRIEELERDLTYTRENLQATIEEQQSSNEELKSTNEELQSTNEELQSTNEELETSKEELQSVNEELITVNAELQAKIEQLAGMQNDMKNLLDNINVGTIFLDDRLAIRRFTREATKVYRLLASDVGRPLSDIKSDLDDEDLLAKAHTVIETLIPYERELRTIGGDWYLTRIQPYRTLDNVIDGVVITFANVSARVAAEMAEQEGHDIAESIVDGVDKPMLVLDDAFAVIFASNLFYRSFKLSPGETRGRLIYSLENGTWDDPALREVLENVLPKQQSFDDFVMSQHKMRLSGRRIVCKSSARPLILLTFEDDTVP
ncbi:chemotaxis protein CheB [Magnetospirillum gryphiswaldense]|uniref:PAS n=1 Tax=Magnetospirillum gryphiswaldense TaxID=55518 RepID=A4TWZ2_9PROT|nr:chemotaxis protein CheB [Magnetospirillum gryphiswaldense]AVM74084.1 Chemotaxis protein methyltransferase Cher2 [Magnetospirillum gryphiswaldense MSR-1]AVM77987.1 Chemotaxis protein methyltransferase Cher2 [Magnetospirillum gryphiswaldense]CAM75149.1 PAS [Magnetospirillum gryphiswaldense MSR-1]